MPLKCRCVSSVWLYSDDSFHFNSPFFQNYPCDQECQPWYNYYKACANVWSRMNSLDLLCFHYLSGGWPPSRLRDHTWSVYWWHACHAAGFNPNGVGRSCHTQVACLLEKYVEHTGSKILHCGRPQECMRCIMYYFRNFQVYTTISHDTIVSQPLHLQHLCIRDFFLSYFFFVHIILSSIMNCLSYCWLSESVSHHTCIRFRSTKLDLPSNFSPYLSFIQSTSLMIFIHAVMQNSA